MESRVFCAAGIVTAHQPRESRSVRGVFLGTISAPKGQLLTRNMHCSVRGVFFDQPMFHDACVPDLCQLLGEFGSMRNLSLKPTRFHDACVYLCQTGPWVSDVPARWRQEVLEERCRELAEKLAKPGVPWRARGLAAFSPCGLFERLLIWCDDGGFGIWGFWGVLGGFGGCFFGGFGVDLPSLKQCWPFEKPPVHCHVCWTEGTYFYPCAFWQFRKPTYEPVRIFSYGFRGLLQLENPPNPAKPYKPPKAPKPPKTPRPRDGRPT